MKTKTKIGKQVKKKLNRELFETIIIAKKNDAWLKVASLLSSPKSRRIIVNLSEIEKQTKEGDTVVIPGKILSQGDITKKIRVAALGFSESAREKLLKTKSEVVTLMEEIKKNPKANGIKIIGDSK
ncbi:MAG: 50S ribosomal protein L18e [Nanoarchaeota archaeon]|nr:50S ribosomal protein L18e [Nanoarchaeota archaeon]